MGSVVLENSDSSTHELSVVVKRYGEVIHEENHVLEAGSSEQVPLREPGSYSVTVALDGETVAKRESLTRTDQCREWRLSFGVSSDGVLKKSRGVACLQ
ncbi:hypothetical protein [Haloprofundus halophilus]|uniref:hypothetical protein n=1 Tax=Haloprofundus halophilus TaxID=2283527 RepID=UPI0013002348|nr:hypothetical protein [Haloprofundus halophilus]